MSEIRMNHLNHPQQDFSQIALGVVCPMANEEDTAVDFVNSVIKQCASKNFRSTTLFVILDRACKDKTLSLLTAHAANQPSLKVVWAPENRGVVDAYVRGYQEALAAGCDWVLEIDAGFSHQPEDIPQFFDKMSEGYDCVFGSRFCEGASISEAPLTRRIVSRGGTLLANSLLGTNLKDMTSGFEMFSRAGLESILQRGIKSHGPFFQTEIKSYCRNLKIAEVPINYRAPSHKINNKALADSFLNLWRLYRLRRLGQL